jgi:hypothetical protein
MLPKVQQSSEFVPPPFVDGRYQKVKIAADKILANESSPEEFAEFIDTTIEFLSEKEANIRQVEIPPEALEDFREELETGLTGIDLFYQGLTEMRTYLEDSDVEHINAGLEIVREANRLLNEALTINRKNRHKLEEMYIDASTTL